MDADKQEFKVCIANLCDELPLVSKIKRWATSGKLNLFYNASDASQRDFVPIDWIGWNTDQSLPIMQRLVSQEGFPNTWWKYCRIDL